MLAAIWGTLALAATPTDESTRLVQIRKAVVVVQQVGATCGGVAIEVEGVRAIATAYHCVASGFGARVTALDGREAYVPVVATDPGHDLALLEGPELDEVLDDWLELGRAPALGASVVVVGHPFAAQPPGGFLLGTLRWSVSHGHVAAVGTRSLQLDGTVHPGNSGGPVIDAESRVVGIVSRKLGAGLTFAGRSEALQALMEAPRRRRFGGTASLAPAVWLTDRLVIGVDFTLTWRERIFASVSGGVPIDRRATEASGDKEATPIVARFGARVPMGAAVGLTLDGFGAVGFTQRWTPGTAGTSEQALEGFVGGAVGRGGLRFEVARRIGREAPEEPPTWLLGLRVGLGGLRRVY